MLSSGTQAAPVLFDYPSHPTSLRLATFSHKGLREGSRLAGRDPLAAPARTIAIASAAAALARVA
jgi:hypothetical protein